MKSPISFERRDYDSASEICVSVIVYGKQCRYAIFIDDSDEAAIIASKFRSMADWIDGKMDGAK